MKSILQDEKECFFCKTTMDLEEHHVVYGTANRKQSEKNGLKVWLCHEHHTGNSGVHVNKDLDTQLKEFAQKTFEESHTHEEWMRVFGKNYL